MTNAEWDTNRTLAGRCAITTEIARCRAYVAALDAEGKHD